MAAGMVLAQAAAPAAPGSAQSVPARGAGRAGFTDLIAELTAGAEEAVPPQPALASPPLAAAGAKAVTTPLQGEHSATESGPSELRAPVATGSAKPQSAPGKPRDPATPAEVPVAVPLPLLPEASVPPPAVGAPAKPSAPAKGHDARLQIPRAPTTASATKRARQQPCQTTRRRSNRRRPQRCRTNQHRLPQWRCGPPQRTRVPTTRTQRQRGRSVRSETFCRPSLRSRHKSSSLPWWPVTPNFTARRLRRMPRRKLPARSAPIPQPPAPPAQAAAEITATVAARIGRAVQDGTHVLTMQLHPAELGRVEVRLSFHDSGVGVQMTLDRAETFDTFSRNRSAMEQHLADSGINLGTGGLDLRFGQQPGPLSTTVHSRCPHRAPGRRAAIQSAHLVTVDTRRADRHPCMR